MSPARGEAILDEAALADQVEIRRTIRALAWGYALERLLEFSLTREVFVASPSAGAEWTATPPAGTTWELLQLREVLVTSAVVANRVATIRVRDADLNTIGTYSTPRNQAAGVNIPYTYSAGLGASTQNSADTDILPGPSVLVLPGSSIASLTANMDVGDQYSAIILLVREWSIGRVARALRYLTDDLESSGGFL